MMFWPKSYDQRPSHSRRHPRKKKHRLGDRVEQCEDRCMLAAPQISAGAYFSPEPSAQIMGYITDENPASVQVNLSGAVSGSASVDSSDNLSFSGTASSLGDVIITAIDERFVEHFINATYQQHSNTFFFSLSQRQRPDGRGLRSGE